MDHPVTFHPTLDHGTSRPTAVREEDELGRDERAQSGRPTLFVLPALFPRLRVKFQEAVPETATDQPERFGVDAAVVLLEQWDELKIEIFGGQRDKSAGVFF